MTQQLEQMQNYMDRTNATAWQRNTYQLNSAELSALYGMFDELCGSRGISKALFPFIGFIFNYGFCRGIRAKQNRAKAESKRGVA